jgi:hypothetical protein
MQCNALQAKGIRVQNPQIKPTSARIAKRDGKEVGLQYCKVSLPDVALSQALDLVCNPTTNQYQLDCGIIIADVYFAHKDRLIRLASGIFGSFMIV